MSLEPPCAIRIPQTAPFELEYVVTDDTEPENVWRVWAPPEPKMTKYF